MLTLDVVIPALGLWSAISEILFFAEESLVGQGFDPNVGNMSDIILFPWGVVDREEVNDSWL